MLQQSASKVLASVSSKWPQRSIPRALAAVSVGFLSFVFPKFRPATTLPQQYSSENSVYVPGAGFSGFWFHLGLFQSMPALNDYDYYCYSSGCLSIVLGFLEAPIDDTYNVCRDIQLEWSQGKISSYDMVDEFLERLLPDDEESFSDLLPRLNVISTSIDSGMEIQQATNRTELVLFLQRTTRIPFLTGRSWLKHGTERYIDGGFSRMFHPPCRWSVQVPFTWNTYIHSLNPGVSSDRVFEFVELGASSSLLFARQGDFN